MSYLLPHLHSGFAVDQAILSVRPRPHRNVQPSLKAASSRHAACLLACRLPQEEDRVVIIRFGHDYEETCMQMDEVRGG